MTNSWLLGLRATQLLLILTSTSGQLLNANGITINVGDTVIWRNVEKRQYHDVWFERSGEEEPDYFFPDESYQRTFQQAGSFDYRCGPHQKMTGQIVVK